MNCHKNSKKKDLESLFWSSMITVLVLVGYVLLFVLRQKLFESVSLLSDLELESSLFEADDDEFVSCDPAAANDTLRGEFEEINSNDIDKDVMQLVLVGETGYGPAASQYCHGSVVNIDEEDNKMHVLTCEHCTDQMVLSRVKECKTFFPGIYYWPGITVSGLILVGCIVGFTQYFRGTNIASPANFVLILFIFVYLYFAQEYVVNAGVEHGIQACVERLNPRFCACPASEVDVLKYGGNAVRACEQYCLDNPIQCVLYSRNAPTDQVCNTCDD